MSVEVQQKHFAYRSYKAKPDVQHHPSYRTPQWRTGEWKLNREDDGVQYNWADSLIFIPASHLTTPAFKTRVTAARATIHDNLRSQPTCSRSWLAQLTWLKGWGVVLQIQKENRKVDRSFSFLTWKQEGEKILFLMHKCKWNKSSSTT